MPKRIVPITRVNKFQLYGLFCPIIGELRYIGITTRSLDLRLKEHLRKPTNGKIGYWFHQLNKMDCKPIIKLLKDFDNYQDLLKHEILKIKECRESGLKILNISDGGDINPMQGKTHSKEAKEKISKSQIGRKRTEKEKIHLSEIMKNKWNGGELVEWSEEMKNALRKRMYGNNYANGLRHSDKTKKIISQTHLGNKYSLGFKHSDKSKELMSKNNSGENNPMYGKSLPKDVLIKRSEKVKRNLTFKGKNNPNFKYDISISELKRLFIDEGKTKKEICQIFGCSEANIVRLLKINDIKKPLSNKYNLDINEINIMLNNGLTQMDIGKYYNCSNKIINKFIKKNKIKE